MADWQERITRDTAPEIRAEHDLRYRLVAPLIATSAVWADLGCGTGVAGRLALGDRRPEHALLIDLEGDVVAGAAEELAIANTQQMVGDLTDSGLLERVQQELLAVEGDRIVTCFEVIEHLSTFLPVLEWSASLAREQAATVVLSVPNDAFWAIDNPYHVSSWSEGAFEELEQFLPDERTIMRQVGVSGSAVIGAHSGADEFELTLPIHGDAAVATHFIAAFGPRHAEISPAAVVAQTDLHEQRRWERQRDSNLAVAEKTVQHQQMELQTFTKQFDEWRDYIHELERQLGKPLAGTEEAAAAERAARAGSRQAP